MSNVSEQIREIQTRMLEDMKRRRAILSRGIANLEHVIDNPNPDYEIDSEAIKEEARKDTEFLEQYEKKHKE